MVLVGYTVFAASLFHWVSIMSPSTTASQRCSIFVVLCTALILKHYCLSLQTFLSSIGALFARMNLHKAHVQAVQAARGTGVRVLVTVPVMDLAYLHRMISVLGRV